MYNELKPIRFILCLRVQQYFTIYLTIYTEFVQSFTKLGNLSIIIVWILIKILPVWSIVFLIKCQNTNLYSISMR